MTESPPAHRVARAARWNVAFGVALLLVKTAAWWQTRSVALLADALESIVNVAAAAAAALAVAVSRRPPDRRHPFGHTKVEYLSAGLEGALVLAAAAAIVREAWQHLRQPAQPAALGVGLALAGAAAAANALLAAYLQRTGRRERSPALVASGAHLWGDVLTTGGVLVGLGAAWVTGRWVLDPLIALLVAVNILRLGWRVVRDSVGGLMDESLAAAEVERIAVLVRREMGGALQYHDLRTRRAGPRPFVELHLVVPGSMRVDVAHQICDRIEVAVQQELPGAHVVVHVEPESELRGSDESSGTGGVPTGP
jgi:cation diffusion facilitator family transporter